MAKHKDKRYRRKQRSLYIKKRLEDYRYMYNGLEFDRAPGRYAKERNFTNGCFVGYPIPDQKKAASMISMLSESSDEVNIGVLTNRLKKIVNNTSRLKGCGSANQIAKENFNYEEYVLQMEKQAVHFRRTRVRGIKRGRITAIINRRKNGERKHFRTS